jgi:hypothetical protein
METGEFTNNLKTYIVQKSPFFYNYAVINVVVSSYCREHYNHNFFQMCQY